MPARFSPYVSSRDFFVQLLVLPISLKPMQRDNTIKPSIDLWGRHVVLGNANIYQQVGGHVGGLQRLEWIGLTWLADSRLQLAAA